MSLLNVLIFLYIIDDISNKQFGNLFQRFVFIAVFVCMFGHCSAESLSPVVGKDLLNSLNMGVSMITPLYCFFKRLMCFLKQQFCEVSHVSECRYGVNVELYRSSLCKFGLSSSFLAMSERRHNSFNCSR